MSLNKGHGCAPNAVSADEANAERKRAAVARVVVSTTLAAILGASCGSTDSGSSPTLAPSTPVVVVGAVTAPATTTGPLVTEPQVAENQTTVDSSPTDDTSAAQAPIPLRDGAKLVPLSRYTTDKLIGDAADFSFQGPASGASAFLGDGVLGVAADANGEQVLMQAAEMDFIRILTNPSQDLDGPIGPDDSEPAPADVLGWFASRPGLTAGPVEDSELGGVPARSMTYSIGTFEGQTSCLASDASPCLAVLYSPQGAGLYYSLGDSGTMYELVVEGRHLWVDVAARPEADTLAASIEFSVHRPTVVPADVPRLPFTGSLAPATRYFWTGSSLGTYVVSAEAGVDVTSNFNFGADPPVQIGVGASRCMTISDGSTSFWFGIDASDNSSVQAMPDDLLAALTSLDLLTVTAPPTVGALGGHATTTLDVSGRGGEVDLLAGSLIARAGTVTRVMLVSRGDGQQPDVVMVDVGSPCESMLASLDLLAAAPA